MLEPEPDATTMSKGEPPPLFARARTCWSWADIFFQAGWVDVVVGVLLLLLKVLLLMENEELIPVAVMTIDGMVDDESDEREEVGTESNVAVGWVDVESFVVNGKLVDC